MEGMKIDNSISQTENLENLLKEIEIPEQVKKDRESFSVLEADVEKVIEQEIVHFNTELHLHLKPDSVSHYKEKNTFASTLYNRIPLGFKDDEDYTYRYTNQYGPIGDNEEENLKYLARMVNETPNTFSLDTKYPFSIELVDDTKLMVKAHLGSPCYIGSKVYKLEMTRPPFQYENYFEYNTTTFNNQLNFYRDHSLYLNNKEQLDLANIVKQTVMVKENVEALLNQNSLKDGIRTVEALKNEVIENPLKYFTPKANRLNIAYRSKLSTLLRQADCKVTLLGNNEFQSTVSDNDTLNENLISFYRRYDYSVGLHDVIKMEFTGPSLRQPITVSFPRISLQQQYWDYIKTLNLPSYQIEGKLAYLVYIPHYLAEERNRDDRSHQLVIAIYPDTDNPAINCIPLNGLPGDNQGTNICRSILEKLGRSHFLYPANAFLNDQIVLDEDSNSRLAEQSMTGDSGKGVMKLADGYTSPYISGELNLHLHRKEGRLSVNTGHTVVLGLDAKEKLKEAIRESLDIGSKEWITWEHLTLTPSRNPGVSQYVSYPSDEVDYLNQPLFYHFERIQYSRYQLEYAGRIVVSGTRDKIDELVRQATENKGIMVDELSPLHSFSTYPNGQHQVTVSPKPNSLYYMGQLTLIFTITP